jgi:hypothetical protein
MLNIKYLTYKIRSMVVGLEPTRTLVPCFSRTVALPLGLIPPKQERILL